ncbi:MAG: ATP-grasp domain-containing protein [Candidatus Paceibacterota bacterium]|jgi:carbamoylphosphate synthase large subunit
MIKKINVLIVPAGSGMAIPAIKALKQDKNIRIVSVDSNSLSPGLYLSHKAYIVPVFKDQLFYPKIKEIVLKEKIDVIIPCLDTILLDFSKLKPWFKEMGAEVMVSDFEAIEITRDKWKTYKALEGIIPLPKSFIKKEDININYPIIIKPRGGSGSQDFHKIDSKEELDFYYKRIENPIIQEYLPGEEYTIDCLAEKNGKLVLTMARERIEAKAGISVKGKVVTDKRFNEMAEKISKQIKFNGPFFFQAKKDNNGNPKLMEINARIAGTMCLSSFAGPNIHLLGVMLALGKKIKIPPIKYGLRVSRYWEELYLTDNKIKKIKKI